MPRYDDSAVREKDQSQLLVKWVDDAGSKFVERTETRDISQTGISFYLKAPIWVDTHLTITIASSALFGRLHKKTAKVVRIQTDASGRQLIGARFDE
jgi:PilZ domain